MSGVDLNGLPVTKTNSLMPQSHCLIHGRHKINTGRMNKYQITKPKTRTVRARVVRPQMY